MLRFSAAFRYSALSAAVMFNPGVFVPFYPLFLAHQGFDPASIGLLLALGGPARVIANPLLLWLVDLGAQTRTMLAATHVVAGALLLASIATTSFWPMAILLTVATFFHAPTMAMVDAATTRAIHRDPRIVYGRVRVWGSISFVAANLIGGLVVAQFSPVGAVWLIIAGMAAAALVAQLAPPDAPHDAPRPATDQPHAAPGVALACVICASALIQSSHAGFYAFSSIHWQARGYSGTLIGALWVIGVVMEILLFARFAALSSRVASALAMMAGGASAAIVRWFAMSFDPPLWLTAVLQASHAITFGLTHIGAMAAFSLLSPPQFRGRAQGLHAGALALLSGVGMYLGGLAYERIGVSAYAWMSAPAIVALIFLVIAAKLAPVQPQSSGSGG